MRSKTFDKAKSGQKQPGDPLIGVGKHMRALGSTSDPLIEVGEH